MRTVLCTALLLVFNSSVVAYQSRMHRATDPFFFIEYDSDKVHFDPIPKMIGERCPQLQNHYAKGWVYGHLKTQETEYFIVDGYVKIESEKYPGQSSVVQEDGFGYIVEIRLGECLVDSTPYVFFPELNKGAESRVHITGAVLDAISAELLARYAKAFGEKKRSYGAFRVLDAKNFLRL